MSTTDTDVIVTQHRAEFRAAPFARPRWEISGGWETRRWTVAREFLAYPGAHSEPARKVPDTGIGHVHESMLIDPDAVVVFIPDQTYRQARYGVAVVIEQRQRAPGINVDTRA